jgi:hypothetical protein
MRPLTSRRRRSSLALVCAVIGCGVLIIGCSEQGAAQDANAPVKVETSQMYVTVRNDSGLPLNEVAVSIVPAGRATVYNKFVGRLENAESKNIMLGEFYGRDGTPFSLRVAKPRSVEVKASDIKGTKYNIEVPWR